MTARQRDALARSALAKAMRVVESARCKQAACGHPACEACLRILAALIAEILPLDRRAAAPERT